MPLASIPSPGHAAWRLGPLTIRAYALCVIAGILVAVASRRYRRSDGRGVARPGVILDVAAWAIPFGLAGAAAHAILLDTRHDFRHAFRLWHTATVGVAVIGVPGAVALGTAGAWIACRRAGVRLGPVAGAAAPGLAFGAALAHLGGWFSQQTYGRPSALPWAVAIAPVHRVPGYENFATFEPVFAYEALWCAVAGGLVLWATRRFTLLGERAFALQLALTFAGLCA